MVKNERGLTLVEVLVSIVIIGIILISFSQFFIQSSVSANRNTEKLVVVHLADGYFERLKALGQAYGEIKTGIAPDPNLFIEMNNKQYKVTVKKEQAELAGLTAVKVTVQAEDSKTKGVVEGFVQQK